MPTLLAPLGLLGLLALALPLAIHLWSHGPGRRVVVGSIRFVPGATRPRWRRLRLHEVPLLAVRLALFTLAALLLARPAWQSPTTAEAAAPDGTVVLVSPEAWTPATAPAFLPVLDSLARAGHRLALLAPGFPPFRLDTEPAPVGGSLDPWQRLSEAAEHFAEATRFVVVGPARQAVVSRRPLLSQAVGWVDRPAPSENRWVAVAPAGGTPLVARSTATATTLEAGALVQEEGALRLPAPDAFPDDDRLRRPRRGARVLVVAGAGEPSLRYVRSALEAAAPTLAVEVVAPDALSAPVEAQWVVWLVPGPVAPSVAAAVKAGTWLLETAAPPGDTVSTWIEDAYQGGVPMQGVPLYRRADGTLPGEVRWRDAEGRPVLSRLHEEQGVHDRLAVRLHPDWTELVLTPAFPAWMGVWLAEAEGGSGLDLRRLSAQQRLPRRSGAAGVRASAHSQPTALHPWLWLALAALVMAERALAWRRAGS